VSSSSLLSSSFLFSGFESLLLDSFSWFYEISIEINSIMYI
jgi:hypothetical protein